MKRLSLLILLLIGAIGLFARKDAPNIVIERLCDTYTLVAAADGSTLDHVDYTTEITFRALRVPGQAQALLYYNDDIAIEKVKGGVQSYGSYFSDDVFFSDSKACLVSVDLKKAGATATVSAKLKFKKPEFFDKIYLTEYYKIERAEVSFVIPRGLDERYRITARNMERTGGCESSEEQQGGKVVRRYVIADIPAAEREPYSPSFNIIAPQFAVRGHFADVDELYRYLYSYTTQTDPGAAGVADKAAGLVEGKTTEADRIAAIVDYVHNNIRYVAVEHGELGHRPDLASEVLRKNFGDCKGSAVLIRDMLRSAGIDSRLVWVGSSDINTRWTDEPALSSGNHMIAAVLTGDSILFVDGTSKYCRPGELPYGIQGRQALIENGPEKPLIADIPVLPARTNAVMQRYDMQLGADGRLDMQCSIDFTGSHRRAIISNVDATPPAKRREEYNRLLAVVAASKENARADYAVRGDTANLSGTVSRSGAVTKAGDLSYVDLNPLGFGAPPRIDTDDRSCDARIGYPDFMRVDMTLHLPEGMAAGELPADFTTNNNWFDASLTTSYDASTRTLHRVLEFEVKDTGVPFDEITTYNSAVNALMRACKSKLPISTI